MTELIENDRIIGGLTEACTQKIIALYQQFARGQCLPTNTATAEMANHHPRVNTLNPGPGVGVGVGDHCISVDPWFLVTSDRKNARLIRAAREVNDAKPQFIIRKVKKAIGGIKNPHIARLGLAFKANVDDMRESPAVEICQLLAADTSTKVHAVEPHIQALPESFSAYGNISLTDTAVKKANVILLLVDHKHFAAIPTQYDLTLKAVIDTRG